MVRVSVDQVNIVVADVRAIAAFLRQLGVDADEAEPEWSRHHLAIPTAEQGFDADLDSSEFARYWGGLPEGFTGVVMNLRVEERAEVDELFERSLSLGAKGLRVPWDAFWGSRYAVIEAPGPLHLGLMSRADASHRTESPAVSDFT